MLGIQSHTQYVDSGLIHDFEQFEKIHSQETKCCQRDLVVWIMSPQ